MPNRYHWSMVEPSIGQGLELYHHSEHQLDGHQEFDSGHLSSSGKELLTELPQPLHMATAFPNYPVFGLQSFGPSILKQEQDSISDCKWSPTLTNSSLVSNTSPLSTLHSISAPDRAANVHGLDRPVYWPISNQLYHIPAYPGNQTSPYWCQSRGELEETTHMHSSSRHMSSEKYPKRAQHPEAEVQALLDRQRRVKTTAENARFHCNECDKGFQRVYNLRSHMLKHQASREKIQCIYPGCNKGFDRKTDLGRHERSVHLQLREHKCVLCGSFFARRDTLVRHIEGSCSKRTGVDRKRPKDSLTPTLSGADTDSSCG